MAATNCVLETLIMMETDTLRTKVIVMIVQDQFTQVLLKHAEMALIKTVTEVTYFVTLI